MRKLIEKIEFNGLVVEIFDDDYLHACQNHNEVSLGKIRRCIKNPDIVIESYQGKNACLFYEVEMNDEFFVVVVHVISPMRGEVRTAYATTYLKKGKILFKRENK